MTVGILEILTPLFFSSTDCQPTSSDRSERSSQWQIRPAKLEDLVGVSEILAQSFHSPTGLFGWAYPLLRVGIYEDIRNRLRSPAPHHICLVAATRVTTNDELAGSIEMSVRSISHGVSAFYTDSHRCRYPYLSNLAVHPNYRRQGVAAQLLLNCERIALCWGFHDLYLHVLEDNHQAKQLYFKLGYQLHKVDTSWNYWLLRQPRQLLLHKRLG